MITMEMDVTDEEVATIVGLSAEHEFDMSIEPAPNGHKKITAYIDTRAAFDAIGEWYIGDDE